MERRPTTERGKKSLALVNSQLISDARSVFLYAHDAPDSGRQVSAQKPTVGGLVLLAINLCEHFAKATMKL